MTMSADDTQTGNPRKGKEGMQGESNFAREQLRQLVERIERLEEEKKTIAEDIKEVYAEAKALGFDTRIMRKVISMRKRDPQEREEEEAMLALYLQALGMLPDVPRADAATGEEA